MSAIVNFNLDLSKIPADKIVKGKKGNYKLNYEYKR